MLAISYIDGPPATLKMFDPSRRRLLQTLILSLFVHAMVLISVISFYPVRMDVPPATMNVVFNAGAPPPVALSGLPESEIPAKAKPQLAPKANLSEFVVKKSPLSTVVLSSSSALPAAPAALAIASSETASTPRVQSEAHASAPAASRDGVNADDLRQYRVALAIAARRFKRYPVLARERGWEGTVEVALAVSAHLPVPDVTLVSSSGHVSLDRQAQEMMAQAARTAVMPESLKGRDFRMLLPVQFSLDGDQ
jgi:protein TonB